MKELVHKNTLRNWFCLFVLLLLFFSPHVLKADDPGISKVRLIQTGENTYTFETDISEALLWTLKNPIFPNRFVLSKAKLSNKSGWVTIRYDISTKGEPLSANDEIILPWARNAVDFTVQWLDGENYKGLFQRELKGIHVPLKELMPVTKSTKELVVENFGFGLQHFPFKGIHILFILALVFLIPNRNVFRALLFMSIGQMLAMLTISLNLNFAGILFSDLLFVLLVLIIAYCLAYGKEFKHIGAALLLLGFIHSTAYSNESALVQELPLAQKAQALFAFNIAMDLGHYCLALLFLGALKVFSKYLLNRTWPAILIGSLSIFLFLLIGSEHILSGETKVLQSNENNSITYSSSGGVSTPSSIKKGSATMTTPIMAFLSVEPYEVRHEILVMARAANELLHFNDDNNESIAVENQERIKENILKLIVENDSMRIDKQIVKPAEASVNFVTLGPGGVSIRENAIEEDLTNGLIGISLLYELEGFPDSIQVQWNVFPPKVEHLEYQAVDPHSTSSAYLTPSNNTFNWGSKLKGYKVKAIEPIEAKRTARPVLSYLLWLLLAAMLLVSLLGHKKSVNKTIFVILLLLSFILFPFVRIAINLPFIPEGKPSEEKAEVVLNSLLSNVYRAFDRRNEDVVYDRLAMSVTEDQLSDIYLQNRQAMALEKRGGAHANVDDVSIKTLYNIKRSENDSYVADTEWTVRGSVNHFGHTHYRQNQYRALVSFLVEDGVWKISRFEILDTQRLY